MKFSNPLFVGLIVHLLFAVNAFTADDAKPENSSKGTGDSNQTANNSSEEEKNQPAEPKTHEVDRKPFEIKVELQGLFESSRMEEVFITTKSWGELLVLDALPQGATVKKGESLVSLNMEKIDEKIRNTRNELVIMDLDRQIAKADLKLAEIMIPMELTTLQQKDKETQEDLARYQKINRPHSEKAAEFNLKTYKDNLSYLQEELKQLKKMYEADDLTEETEEIILQRAENAVERANFSLEGAKIRHEETLQFNIPREGKSIREAAKRNQLALQAALKIKPAELAKKQLESKKLERQREKTSESLSRLEHDRKAMKVPSPASGVVYRGSFDRGKWSGAGTLKNRLRRGGVLKPHEVFMTIVGQGPIFMRATLTEKDIRKLQPGAKGKVKTIAYPDLQLSGTVREISATPVAPGQFDVMVDVSMPKDAPDLLPGMNGKIEIVTYRSERALVVPSSAVFKDEKKGEGWIAYIHREGKKPTRKVIKVGKKSGNLTEILGGLKDGQKILAEKPGK
tara:strand:- start:216 stop:1748 length:1533 start_codon:yes stop_codon:yes gene_type:complete